MLDDKSPLKVYCPDKIDIDLSGKRREWEGIVILPMVDYQIVRKSYFELLNKLDSKDLKRNKMGKTFIYKYNPGQSFIFHSYYGNIDNCRVSLNMIEI